jgi:uncharacterized protein (DUF952 family)
MSMNPIYHITARTAWEEACILKSYRPVSLKLEGFIHCSKKEQVLRVANAFYAGQKNLLLLVVDPEKTTAEIRWEPGSDKPDELFPHIYGELNIDAVEKVVEFNADVDGHYSMPAV